MTNKARESQTVLSEVEITRTLEAGMQDADKERAHAFQDLRLLQAARIRGRERQLERLGAARGGAEDARTRAVSAKLELDRGVERALGMEAARASKPTPPLDPEAWILHGHVLYERLDPAPGVLVAIADPKGQPIKAHGGRTDNTGYFKLSVPVPPEEPTEGLSPEQPRTPQRSRRGRKSGPDQVIVRVLAGRSRVLFDGDTPLSPVRGGVEYMEIVLKDRGKGPSGSRRGSRPLAARAGGRRGTRQA